MICRQQNVNICINSFHISFAVTYLPQFPFTFTLTLSSFFCAGELSPGFLKNSTECISVYRLASHCHAPSKIHVRPHLRLFTGGSLQGHSGGHHGVTNFTQGWRGLPLGGACWDVPVVCAWCIPHPHPSWRQVCVSLKSTGIPKGLWKGEGKGETWRRGKCLMYV